MKMEEKKYLMNKHDTNVGSSYDDTNKKARR